ncbi:hypothetical protein RYX36_008476 [Vicia faba]
MKRQKKVEALPEGDEECEKVVKEEENVEGGMRKELKRRRRRKICLCGVKIDSILDEDFGSDLVYAAYMNDVDREGHLVCYNIYGVFAGEEIYQKSFGSKEKRKEFLRCRCYVYEKWIQKLD